MRHHHHGVSLRTRRCNVGLEAVQVIRITPGDASLLLGLLEGEFVENEGSWRIGGEEAALLLQRTGSVDHGSGGDFLQRGHVRGRDEKLHLSTKPVHAGASRRQLRGQSGTGVRMEFGIDGDERHATVGRIDEGGSRRFLQILARPAVLDTGLVECADRHEQPLRRVVERMVVRAPAPVKAVGKEVGHDFGTHYGPGAATPRGRRACPVIDHTLKVDEACVSRGDPRLHLRCD